MVTIRTAVPADLDAIRDVFRRASLADPDDREALLAHPEFLVWPADGIAAGRTRVAVDGGLAGFASTVAGDGFLELEDLFVAPERMRQGVARRLVADAVATARAAGVPVLRVTGNAHALPFYTAVGFLPDGTDTTPLGPAPRLRLPL